MTSLERLPLELLLDIAELLETKDLASWVLTSKCLYSRLIQSLYNCAPALEVELKSSAVTGLCKSRWC
jgi:hypothetical protein